MTTNTQTYTIATELLTQLSTMPAVTIRDMGDAYAGRGYEIRVALGRGWAGMYTGGEWGDVEITDDALEFVTHITDDVWDIEQGVHGDAYNIGEGTVALTYADFDEAGLAYTSALEDKICDAIARATGGLLSAEGSEQGMQGMDSAEEAYLSLDVAQSMPAHTDARWWDSHYA
tara:strand:+ start:497 stop:1015 length:519 start_codon:yes stop_codon:yes gene_type:complete